MAKEYLEVQKELQWMTKYCNELVEHLEETKKQQTGEQRPTSLNQPLEQSQLERSVEEFVRLENEKKSLLEFHRNLKEQLSKVHREQLQMQQQQQQQRQVPQPNDQSRSSPLPDDGWVVLSRRFFILSIYLFIKLIFEMSFFRYLNNGGAELVLKNYCYFVFHCSYNIYRVKSFPFTNTLLLDAVCQVPFPSRLGVAVVFFCRCRQIFSCGLIALALKPATPLARFSLQTRCCLCVKLCAMDDISPAYRHPKARIVRPQKNFFFSVSLFK